MPDDLAKMLDLTVEVLHPVVNAVAVMEPSVPQASRRNSSTLSGPGTSANPYGSGACVSPLPVVWLSAAVSPPI
jgi:hypothetical protein